MTLQCSKAVNSGMLSHFCKYTFFVKKCLKLCYYNKTHSGKNLITLMLVKQRIKLPKLFCESLRLNPYSEI